MEVDSTKKNLDFILLYREAKKAKELAEKGQARISKLQEITSSLSGAVTQTEICDVLLRFLSGLFPFDEIALLLAHSDGEAFECSTISKTGQVKSYPKFSLKLTDPVAKAMVKKKKLLSTNYFIVPLLFQTRFLGAIKFKNPESCIYSREERLFLDAITQQAAQALERSRLFESELILRHHAENDQQRFKFLSEASLILSENLNHEKTLKKIVSHSVPRFADGCVVDLFKGGQLFRVAAAHVNPKKEVITHEIACRSGFKIRSPMDVVLSSGEPILITDMKSVYQRIEADGRNCDALKFIGMKSLIMVPLGPKEKPIGAMGFCTSETERIFDHLDVTLAVEISRRATVAIENAKLFNQAQESVKLRDDFLSIASHELKTPLTSICLQLDLVKRSNDLQSDNNSRLAKAFEVFDLQSARLAKLIDSLLDFTLIQAGKLSLSLEMINLSELVELAVETLPTSIPKPILRLDEEIVGFWDRTRLDQVIVNLISNGIKYGGEKPLHIEISSNRNHAILKVQDFGMGIAKSDQEIIFDRFQRAKGEFKAWGMGLGLFITRQIVEAHHGTIKIESEMNKGSTFIVEIPLPILDRLAPRKSTRQTAPMLLH
jgi:K+-sensing histidine kinase KdpD